MNSPGTIGTSIHEAARRWHALGYRLAAWPAGQGKGPNSPGWGLRPASPDSITDRDNIGVVHGLSGTAALDVDDLERTREVFEALGLDLERLWPATLAYRGKPSRLKLLYRAPSPALGVKKLRVRVTPGAEPVTVFELRGAEAGKQAQDVLPPSVHPDTKRPYELLTPPRPVAELPELPAELATVWREWKQWEPALRRLLGDVELAARDHATREREHGTRTEGHPSVIDAFNARHDCAEVLERNGYRKQGPGRWLRPDSTTGAAGVVLLKPTAGRPLPPGGAIFSHGGGVLADDKPHDAFDLFRILEHGGDTGAAVRAAAELLGMRRPKPAEPAPAPLPRDASPKPRETGPTKDGASEAPSAPRILLGPECSTLRADLFERPPEPPAMVIEGFEPRDAGVIPGAGGTGKTTLELWLAIHRILGWAVFGREIVQPGPVLYVSAEDSRERLAYRLWRLCDALNMSDANRRLVIAGLHIEDLSGTRWRLVEANERGILSATALGERLADLYAGRGLSAAILDPLVYFGPGERFVNDGEAETLLAARTLSRSLSCAVRFPHHTGKGQFRDGATDQYAGRGGSAGADNARFVHVLVAHTAGSVPEPAGLRGEDIAAGNILRLHVAKLTDGRRPTEPLWLRRDGWRFDWIPPRPEDPAARELAAIRELCAEIRAGAAEGVLHTSSTLEQTERPREHIRNRNHLRTLLHVAKERGHVVERELPRDERRGKRTHVLEVVSSP